MCAEKANISHKQLWDGTSRVAFGLEYKCYNENKINAMYTPSCINVIFSIVIFQLPFCGNASNANNEAT
jgi:hypothetical protein